VALFGAKAAALSAHRLREYSGKGKDGQTSQGELGRPSGQANKTLHNLLPFVFVRDLRSDVRAQVSVPARPVLLMIHSAACMATANGRVQKSRTSSSRGILPVKSLLLEVSRASGLPASKVFSALPRDLEDGSCALHGIEDEWQAVGSQAGRPVHDLEVKVRRAVAGISQVAQHKSPLHDIAYLDSRRTRHQVGVHDVVPAAGIDNDVVAGGCVRRGHWRV
jgi:hypothetical protein